MDENNKNGQGAQEQPTNEKKNWKQIGMNVGRRIFWAAVGVGATLGIQALKNRKKNHQ